MTKENTASEARRGKTVPRGELAEGGLGRGGARRKGFMLPFQGNRCALDSSATSDWSDH